MVDRCGFENVDERFMREALAEAEAARELGEVPIGAVMVCEGRVIARAHNRRELDADPSAHAEFSALREAARVLGRWRLSGCTVYVTLEPCLMCAGLMVNARVDRCVYGAADRKAGALGSLYRLHADARLNHGFEVVSGVLADECAGLLQEFFAGLRHGRDAELAGNAAHARALAEVEAEAVAGECSCCCGVDSAGAGAAGEMPAADLDGESREGNDAAVAGRCRSDATAEMGGNAPERCSPKVVLAIDSFKGSASSAQVEEWVAEGVRRVAPQANILQVPLADGGEGTVDAFAAALGGEVRELEVTGPLGSPVRARYLLGVEADGAPCAVVEMAQAAGIGYSPCTEEAALAASTRGAGEMLLDAVAAGARRVYVGLGGSATNDGGAGMLQALGAKVVDAQGSAVEPGLFGLADVAAVDLAPAVSALAGVELVALSDVTNPLVGKRGALAVFGPQKGLPAAGTAELAELDTHMVAYGRLLDGARAADARFRSVLSVPGAGAAGGLGAALLALGAELTSGAEALLAAAGFDSAVETADLVITGEGNMDEQTAGGKAPACVAAHVKHAALGRCPVVAVVGGRAEELDAVYKAGIDLVLPVCRKPMPLAQALAADEARTNLVCAGEAAARAAFEL